MVLVKKDQESIRYSDRAKPNTWGVNILSDGRTQIITRCSHNHIGSLTDHTIADDGTVSPSVVCQHPGCDFHEFIKLDEWPSFIK